MARNRIYRKTTIVMTILTDDPNFEAERLDLSNVLEGAVIETEVKENKVLTGEEMVDACYEARSSPSYFFLDDDGNEDNC